MHTTLAVSFWYVSTITIHYCNGFYQYGGPSLAMCSAGYSGNNEHRLIQVWNRSDRWRAELSRPWMSPPPFTTFKDGTQFERSDDGLLRPVQQVLSSLLSVWLGPGLLILAQQNSAHLDFCIRPARVIILETRSPSIHSSIRRRISFLAFGCRWSRVDSIYYVINVELLEFHSKVLRAWEHLLPTFGCTFYYSRSSFFTLCWVISFL